MTQLNFDQLPQEVAKHGVILEQIKNLLEHLVSPTREEFLNLNETANFLGLSKQTIYNKVANRTIPHQRKGGRLYFLSSELSEWIKSGKRKTSNEIKEDAVNYSNKKGGLK